MNCDPGYESDLPPTITCVDGNYEPYRPEEFVCQKTVALIVTKAGEMEVFGEESKCNRIMGNIPPMALGGHTVDLLDNYRQSVAGAATDDTSHVLLRGSRDCSQHQPQSESFVISQPSLGFPPTKHDFLRNPNQNE